MDRWDHPFATSSAELDIRDAVLALERVLDLQDIEVPLRITLQAAAAALRELEGSSAPDAEGLDADLPLRSS